MSTSTNNKNGRLVSAALLLSAASLGSRLVGIIRERVLTTTFGAGDKFDAFVAAFRLPDLIFNLVVVGALSAAFIPLFTEKLVKGKKGRDEANDFGLSILNIVLIFVAVLSGIYALAAPVFVPLITPGFTGDKLRMTIELSRIMALQPVLLGISFVFSGILNSHKKFFAYALAPILYNVGIIIGVIYFYPVMGLSGLGWGVVLGALLHMGIQLPYTLATGFRWKPVIHWASDDVKKLRRMIIPRMISLAGDQINMFVVTILGSGMSGAISVFHVANNIQSLPVGLFGLAFAQAAFPSLAEEMARGRKKAFLDTLTKSFRYILFFIIPTSVFFYLLRAQMIRVLFGDGAFDWNDTIMTFHTFGILILSLFAQATAPLLARAFFVRQNTKIPVMAAIVGIVVNIALALLLVPACKKQFWLFGWHALPCGVEGLALAFSISAIVELVLLLGAIHWELGGFNDEEVLWSTGRIAVASVLAGAVVQILKVVVATIVTTIPRIDMHTFWGVFLQLAISGAGGVVAYIGFCLLLRCDELAVVRKYIPRQFRLSDVTDTPRFGGMAE